MAKFYTYPTPIICECGWHVIYNPKNEKKDYMTISCHNHKCKNYKKIYMLTNNVVSVAEIKE